jgi:hypothetical protein
MGFFERPYFVQTDNRRKKAQKLFRFKDFDLVAVMFFCCKKNSYEKFTFHFFRSFNPKKGSYTKETCKKKSICPVSLGNGGERGRGGGGLVNPLPKYRYLTSKLVW